MSDLVATDDLKSNNEGIIIIAHTMSWWKIQGIPNFKEYSQYFAGKKEF